jgi:hypothetical protein
MPARAAPSRGAAGPRMNNVVMRKRRPGASSSALRRGRRRSRAARHLVPKSGWSSRKRWPVQPAAFYLHQTRPNAKLSHREVWSGREDDVIGTRAELHEGRTKCPLELMRTHNSHFRSGISACRDFREMIGNFRGFPGIWIRAAGYFRQPVGGLVRPGGKKSRRLLTALRLQLTLRLSSNKSCSIFVL